MSQNMDRFVEAGQEQGFKVAQDVDYGAGPIDIVWNIRVDPSLPELKCGFVRLEYEEGGSRDEEDNQLSLRKIEEAAIRGLRSGLDKVYLVADNEEMARSISGKIEWLASHGSLLRLDAVSLGLSPDQRGSAVVTPSQKRVLQGEKIRKQRMREREAKIEKHSRPSPQRRKQEGTFKEQVRESRIDRNSRPRGQKPKRS
jgi:hypothetical protein